MSIVEDENPPPLWDSDAEDKPKKGWDRIKLLFEQKTRFGYSEAGQGEEKKKKKKNQHLGSLDFLFEGRRRRDRVVAARTRARDFGKCSARNGEHSVGI